MPAPKIPAVQLAIRFGLEIGALVALGRWAATLVAGPWSYAAAFGAPAVAATLWVTFAVRDDPSRSGRAPVPVPGLARLALELAVFLGGAAALGARGSWIAFGVFVSALVVHHAMTRARLRWLLQQ